MTKSSSNLQSRSNRGRIKSNFAESRPRVDPSLLGSKEGECTTVSESLKTSSSSEMSRDRCSPAGVVRWVVVLSSSAGGTISVKTSGERLVRGGSRRRKGRVRQVSRFSAQVPSVCHHFVGGSQLRRVPSSKFAASMRMLR